MVIRAGLLAAAMTCAASPLAAQAPEEAFDQACHAYDQGKFDEAAEGFRSVLRYRVADPRVEYNLANAEYKRGRLGEAILHYERARRLDPGDPEIASNLALASAKRRDVVPEETGPGIGLVALQDRLGAGRQALLALVGVWAVAGLVGWSTARAGGFTPARGWTLAGVTLVTLLALLSWRATERRLFGSPRAVVMRASVEALAGPGMENAAVFTLHEGTTVAVRGEREGWLQVELPNGITGWVAQDAAERI